MNAPTLYRATYQASAGRLHRATFAARDMQAENTRLQEIVETIDALIVESVWRTGKKTELIELIEAIRGELREDGR